MWPQMCTAITTIKGARMCLNAAKAKVDEFAHHGGLGESEATRLLDQIANAIVDINGMSPELALPAEQQANFVPDNWAETPQAARDVATKMKDDLMKEPKKLKKRSSSIRQFLAIEAGQRRHRGRDVGAFLRRDRADARGCGADASAVDALVAQRAAAGRHLPMILPV